MNSISSNRDGLAWTVMTIGMLSTVALVFINSLALAGHVNSTVVGACNASIFGAFALTSLSAVVLNFHLGDDTGNAICISTFIVLSIITAAASLAIPQVISGTTVIWITAPIVAICGVGVLGFIGHSFYGCVERMR